MSRRALGCGRVSGSRQPKDTAELFMFYTRASADEIIGARFQASTSADADGAWEVQSTKDATGLSDPRWALSSKTELPYVAFKVDASDRISVDRVSLDSSTKGFSVTTLGEATNVAALYHEIAVDADDTVYVAYVEPTGTRKLFVRQRAATDTSWSTVTGGPASDGAAQRSMMVVSPLNVLYVAYMDDTVSAKLTVKRLVGGAWQAVGPAGFTSAIEFREASFAMTFGRNMTSTDEHPIVAYTDVDNNRGLSVKMFEGGDWDYLGGTAAVSNGEVQNLGAAVDSHGWLYVVFSDSFAGNRGTCMAYRPHAALCVRLCTFSAVVCRARADAGRVTGARRTPSASSS